MYPVFPTKIVRLVPGDTMQCLVLLLLLIDCILQEKKGTTYVFTTYDLSLRF